MLDARDRVDRAPRRSRRGRHPSGGEGGGTTRADARSAPTALTAEQRRRLAAAGRAIAAHFGVPQDIEWAFAGERLWILQARPLTALPPAPRRVNPVRRMMGSIVAELLPVRPYPLDMSTWTLRGHGRILTRMLAEIPGVQARPRAGCCPRPRASSTSSCRPSRDPTRAHARRRPARAIRQARRFDTREWTRDPRFATVRARGRPSCARSIRARSAWRELVGIPDRVLASLDGLITLRIDYLPHAGLSLLKLRLRLGVLGLLREAGPLSRGVRTRTADANAGPRRARRLGRIATRVAGGVPRERSGRVRAPGRDRRAARRASRAASPRTSRSTGTARCAAPSSCRSRPGARRRRSCYAGIAPSSTTPRATGRDGGGDRGRRRRAPARAAGACGSRARRRRSSRRPRPRGRASPSARTPTSMPRAGFPALRAAMLEAGRRLAARACSTSADDVLHLRLAEITALAEPEAADAALRDDRARTQGASGELRGRARSSRPRRSTRIARGSARRARRRHARPGGGRASGAVRVVLEPARVRLAPARRGARLPVHEPVLDAAVRAAAAVVVDTGGLASHAAIVAREYGIPAVMGTGVGHAGAARRRPRHGRRRCRARACRAGAADDRRSSPGAAAPRRGARGRDPRRRARRARRASGYAGDEHGCRRRPRAREQGVAVPAMAGQGRPRRRRRLPDSCPTPTRSATPADSAATCIAALGDAAAQLAGPAGAGMRGILSDALGDPARGGRAARSAQGARRRR